MSEPLSGVSLDAERKRAAEQTRQEHERRCARLLDEGWEQVSETSWRKDTSDPRWATTAVIEINGQTPEEASRAAWYRQAELDAVAKAKEGR